MPGYLGCSWAMPSSEQGHVRPSNLRGCGKRIKSQTTMRATSVLRLVDLGAIGCGIGGAIATVTLLVPLVGAIGGAFLGLVLKDGRKVGILALLGALGTYLGFIAANVALMAGLPVESSTGKATVMGAIVGALLGVGFADWKRVVGLAVVGAVGFGAGGAIAGVFQFWFLLADLVGGASLGAALGYLESRKLASEQRPRVR